MFGDFHTISYSLFYQKTEFLNFGQGSRLDTFPRSRVNREAGTADLSPLNVEQDDLSADSNTEGGLL